jgi:phosphate transport system protein
MRVRTILDRQIQEIRDNILRLSSMVENAIGQSSKALAERDSQLAHAVSAHDQALNDLRFAIEEGCYRLLATQQPNATDLRTIVGMVSVATNLERMGDHAAGMARLVIRLNEEPPLPILVSLYEMAEGCRWMANQAVESFLRPDTALAEQVSARDAHIDHLHLHVYNTLIQQMRLDTTLVQRATNLLWVSHHLERTGDRAINICERTIYVTTGQLKEFGHNE